MRSESWTVGTSASETTASEMTAGCTVVFSPPDLSADSSPSATSNGTFSYAYAIPLTLRGTQALFCSWGGYDRNQFRRDATRHRVKLPLGEQHKNLKEGFSRRLGESRQYGTGQALRRVGLGFHGTHHRAIDDARNIARLLPYVLGTVPIPGVPAGPR